MTRSLLACVVPALVAAVASCGGGDSPMPPARAAPPGVQLGVKLPRRDLEPTESIVASDGEAVVLRWTVTGDPETCRGRGDWSGVRSASGGVDTTAALSGPRHLTFVVRCRNSAGRTADTAEVSVGGAGEVHATSNRPDGTARRQVKLFYAIAFNDVSRDLDLNGRLQADFERFQRRFSAQVSDERFRVDTFEGGYDVTFLEVPFFEHPGLDTTEAIVEEIEQRGLFKDRYTIVVYYDSEVERSGCGSGGDRRAFVWLDNCGLGDGADAGQSLLHALGLVDDGAPHARDRHVTDHDADLMDRSPPTDFIVDFGRDDYYSEDGLPRDVTNLAESPLLVPGSE